MGATSVWTSAEMRGPVVPQAQGLASLAVGALLDEARLTPKPGLVDARGPGAHHDLSLALLERSAKALEPYFAAMARAAAGNAPSVFLRETLGMLGRRAESAMLVETGGVNTHRGAIWAMGLLVAAAASAVDCVEGVCGRAAEMAALPDRYAPQSASHGREALRRFGAGGARSEAVAGFPHVRERGLPALRVARSEGKAERHARLDALLAIMCTLEDTCLLYRGGRKALEAAQEGARRALACGGSSTAEGAGELARLDAELLARWASPGGAADLLAATLFVDALFPQERMRVAEVSCA